MKRIDRLFVTLLYSFSSRNLCKLLTSDKHLVPTGGFLHMRGRKTDKILISEIAELLKQRHRPAEIVRIMAERLPRRTVYRIIANLKMEAERRRLEREERLQEEMVLRTLSRYEILQSRKRYRKVSGFPHNLWRIRSF